MCQFRVRKGKWNEKYKNVGEREGEDIKENDKLFQYRSSHVTSGIYYEILYIPYSTTTTKKVILST